MGDKIINNKKDRVVEKINSLLRGSDGLTITEIVKKTKLNRSSIRTALAKLDGAGKVSVRKIGMAKVYLLNNQKRLSDWRKRWKEVKNENNKIKNSEIENFWYFNSEEYEVFEPSFF